MSTQARPTGPEAQRSLHGGSDASQGSGQCAERGEAGRRVTSSWRNVLRRVLLATCTGLAAAVVAVAVGAETLQAVVLGAAFAPVIESRARWGGAVFPRRLARLAALMPICLLGASGTAHAIPDCGPPTFEPPRAEISVSDPSPGYEAEVAFDGSQSSAGAVVREVVDPDTGECVPGGEFGPDHVVHVGFRRRRL